MKQAAFEHTFVEAMPRELEEGKLYISMRYRTASHLCACGCGNKVVTPIKPPKWHLYFDGKSVSLWPSIGRWQLPCRSHYWIEHGKVRWSTPWTPEQIEAGRMRDAEYLQRYYKKRDDGGDQEVSRAEPVAPRAPKSWRPRVKAWFGR